MQELEYASDVSYLSCDGESVDLVLVPGGHGLESISLGVANGEDLEGTEKQLRDRGFAVTAPAVHVPGVQAVIEHVLPTGHKMQVALGDKHATGVTRREWDGVTTAPIDIDHVTMVAADIKASSEQLMDRFGYKLTEAVCPQSLWVGAFLRASDRHHDLAVLAAPRPEDTLHHVAFWVGGIAHQALIADRLADNGTYLEFGPGKHGGLADQLVMYAFDPSGNRIEFCGSMATIGADEPHITTGAEVGAALNKWTPGYAPATYFSKAS